MSKAKGIVRIDSSTNALNWAAAVLKIRFAEVLSLRENALNSADIEGVHQMRVAIRRLRSALRDFSKFLKSRLLKKSKKELKVLADMLGQARDQDVAIAGLEKLRDKAKNEHVKDNIETKIKTKIEKRRLIRDKTQIKLTEILDKSSLEKLNKYFSEAVDDAVKKNKKDTNLTTKEAGREVILRSMQEFCDLSNSLYNPFKQLKIHQLRISAKRLRYAIELFTTCWGEEIQPFAEEVSEMQNFLGELHDCDIWIESLSKRLSKEKSNKQHADFWLLSKFTKTRTKNYRAALHLWNKWEKTKFMKHLQETLETN